MEALDLMKMTPKELEKLEARKELRRWIEALRLLARAPRSVRNPMLRLLGDRPYLFERNTGRWPDGLWHLVDRGYEPFAGIELTSDQLRGAGVERWVKSCYVQVGFTDECRPLMDDVFMNRATPLGLITLSNVLFETVSTVEEGLKCSPSA